MSESIAHRIDRYVQPLRIPDSPVDRVHRYFLQGSQRFSPIELLRTGTGREDHVPERIAFGPLDLPASFEALLVDVEQLRVRFVAEQRVVRQKRQLIV